MAVEDGFLDRFFRLFPLQIGDELHFHDETRECIGANAWAAVLHTSPGGSFASAVGRPCHSRPIFSSTTRFSRVAALAGAIRRVVLEEVRLS